MWVGVHIAGKNQRSCHSFNRHASHCQSLVQVKITKMPSLYPFSSQHALAGVLLHKTWRRNKAQKRQRFSEAHVVVRLLLVVYFPQNISRNPINDRSDVLLFSDLLIIGYRIGDGSNKITRSQENTKTHGILGQNRHCVGPLNLDRYVTPAMGSGAVDRPERSGGHWLRRNTREERRPIGITSIDTNSRCYRTLPLERLLDDRPCQIIFKGGIGCLQRLERVSCLLPDQIGSLTQGLSHLHSNWTQRGYPVAK